MEGHNQLGEDLKNAIPTTVPDDVSTVTDSELYSSLWHDGEYGGGARGRLSQTAVCYIKSMFPMMFDVIFSLSVTGWQIDVHSGRCSSADVT